MLEIATRYPSTLWARHRYGGMHRGKIIRIPLLLFSWGGVRPSPLGTSATNWPIVPAPDNRWWWMWSSRQNENWQGKLKCSEKISPNANLPTINSTWPDLGWNLGRGGKPTNNRLRYGEAFWYSWKWMISPLGKGTPVSVSEWVGIEAISKVILKRSFSTAIQNLTAVLQLARTITEWTMKTRRAYQMRLNLPENGRLNVLQSLADRSTTLISLKFNFRQLTCFQINTASHYDPVTGSCGSCNESSGSKRVGTVHEQVGNCLQVRLCYIVLVNIRVHMVQPGSGSKE
jgi:hypothetical protein